MSAALLSIRPEYVNKIFSGEKQYEFRKTIFKNPITKILIYETSPTKKVVGEAEIEEVIIDSLEIVWEKTKDVSGITIEFFNTYYEGREKAIAYKLRDVKSFENPYDLADYGIAQAPQSYIYISENI